MNKIGIFVNQSRDPKLDFARRTAEALLERGKTVLVDHELKDELLIKGAQYISYDEMIKSSNLVVALGGDGTILKIIGEAAEYDTPVIGINLGHLGFLTQAEKGDDEIFDLIADGNFTINRVMMLKTRIFKDGVATPFVYALNDIIFCGTDSKMISLEAEVDGTVTNRYLADGIIISTPTGSTAYSLSCGGPIIHQDLDCITLTPVCPHTLKSRCIVVPPESRIVLRFDEGYPSLPEVKADGQIIGTLSGGDYIEIIKSERRASLAVLDGHNYFDVIRKKLSD